MVPAIWSGRWTIRLESDIAGGPKTFTRPDIQQPRCHDNQTCCRQYPVSRLFQIINFDTFGGEATESFIYGAHGDAAQLAQQLRS
jgi:hypothetical protein